MKGSTPPPNDHHASGPVWCENRGRSAVVTLVTPSPDAGPPYVQWCSLVGANLTCDENCVRRAAKWVGAQRGADGIMSRRSYVRVRDVVVRVMETAERASVELEEWSDWARGFSAGVACGTRAWRAAEAAHATSQAEGEPAARLVVLAAADAAWAAVHASAGNIALALESTSRAYQRLNSVPARTADS